MKDDLHNLIPSFIEIDKKLEHLDTLSYKIQVKIEDIF